MSTPATTDGLVVVHVRDQVNRTLAGHDGREYTSPPHHRTDALILVALLLGRPARPNGNARSKPVGAVRSPAGSARSPSTQSKASRDPPAKGPGDDRAGPVTGRRSRLSPRRLPTRVLTLLCLAPALDALAAITGNRRPRDPRGERRPRGATCSRSHARARDQPARRRGRIAAQRRRLTDRRPLRGGLFHRTTQPHRR